MKTINERNTETVEQVLREINDKIYKQEVHINGLNNTISTLYERINLLEKMVFEQKIKSSGHGPTVK